ncbi:MAG: NfeD family protein [Pirellulales bacterium]|jgi:membrane-bound ClpP family serine protease
MDPIIIALILLVVGLALIFLELFIPSAGLLSVLAVTSLIGSVVWAYMECGIEVGTIFFAAVVIIVPTFITVALKWWPHTPIGRWILLSPPSEEACSSETLATYAHLVGMQGTAKCTLLPGGVAIIEDQQYDVVTDGSVIDKGDVIEVIEVDGTRIVVTLASKTGSKIDLRSRTLSQDPLAQSIESIGIDPLDDPLA